MADYLRLAETYERAVKELDVKELRAFLLAQASRLRNLTEANVEGYIECSAVLLDNMTGVQGGKGLRLVK